MVSGLLKIWILIPVFINAQEILDGFYRIKRNFRSNDEYDQLQPVVYYNNNIHKLGTCLFLSNQYSFFRDFIWRIRPYRKTDSHLIQSAYGCHGPNEFLNVIGFEFDNYLKLLEIGNRKNVLFWKFSKNTFQEYSLTVDTEHSFSFNGQGVTSAESPKVEQNANNIFNFTLASTFELYLQHVDCVDKITTLPPYEPKTLKTSTVASTVSTTTTTTTIPTTTTESTTTETTTESTTKASTTIPTTYQTTIKKLDHYLSSCKPCKTYESLIIIFVISALSVCILISSMIAAVGISNCRMKRFRFSQVYPKGNSEDPGLNSPEALNKRFNIFATNDYPSTSVENLPYRYSHCENLIDDIIKNRNSTSETFKNQNQIKITQFNPSDFYTASTTSKLARKSVNQTVLNRHPNTNQILNQEKIEKVQMESTLAKSQGPKLVRDEKRLKSKKNNNNTNNTRYIYRK